MKLGLLGGSFNPPHFGHLAMAAAAQHAHALSEVLFIPAGSPPHKREDLAGAEHRVRMAELSISGHPTFRVCDIEVRRAGTTYTVDTLEELARARPRDELYFILGEDSLRDLPGWRNPSRILELARLVVVNRPGHARTRLAARDLPGVAPTRIEQIELDRVTMAPSDCESRLLREAWRAGRSIRGSVPDAVIDYMRRHGLYRE